MSVDPPSTDQLLLLKNESATFPSFLGTRPLPEPLIILVKKKKSSGIFNSLLNKYPSNSHFHFLQERDFLIACA